ncbi:MAG: hypothetical protein M3232_02275 [Thermoproteota archaeon]|nr:hypothetical protein [Thermoproteota archaeon]
MSNRVTTRTEGANITNLISAEPGLLGLASQSNSVEESILNKAIVAKKEPTEAIAVEMTLSLGHRGSLIFIGQKPKRNRLSMH